MGVAKRRAAGQYVSIYSAKSTRDEREAQCLRDILKAGDVRVRLGYSLYVGHRGIEVHEDDLRRASRVLREHHEPFVAKCARMTLKDMVDEGRRVWQQ